MEITTSSDADLTVILDWLKDEHAREGSGFHSNAEMIRKGHQAGDELFVLREENDVVAFALGEPGAIDIFEVRPDCRGKGYGRALAQFCLERAVDNDIAVMEFECAPGTSLPFWEKMGFTQRRAPWGHNPWVIKRMTKSLIVPDGDPADVTIRILSEEFAYRENIGPIEEHHPSAIIDSEGTIWLETRIPIIAPELPAGKDVAVEILIDGARRLIGKAKHSAPRKSAVSIDPRGNFYIDRILPSDGLDDR